ncbi:MAG: hypothetical protein RL514_3589 [Verrucomicrobiota bacterium]|jgi:TPR repeat protein
MNKPDPKHFATLGLATGVSPEQIKRAYLALVKRWHPDRFANNPEQQKLAEEKMRTINAAYEALQGRPKLEEFFQHGSTAPAYDPADVAQNTERGAYAYRERPSAFAFWRGHTGWLSWAGTVILVGIAAASFWFSADTLANHYGPPYAADSIRHDAKLQSVFFKMRRAADAGEVWAMVNMGWFYLKGRGVAVNKVEAADWFARAARAGDVGGQVQLGLMFAQGDGVPVDFTQAYLWWQLAAANGNPEAARHRDTLLRNMTEQQVAEGLRRFREATAPK